MALRSAPLALVLAALAADSRSELTIARYAVLAAVPVVAVAALACFGVLVDRLSSADETLVARAEVTVAGVALAFVVISSAARTDALPGDAPSPLAHSALTAAAVLLGVQAAIALAAAIRSRRSRLAGVAPAPGRA